MVLVLFFIDMQSVIKRYHNSIESWLKRLRSVDIEAVTVDEMLRMFNECLEDAYYEGYAAVGYQLGDEVNRPINSSSMTSVISQTVAGKSTDMRVIEYVLANDLESLIVVMDTEYHRVYGEAGLDRAIEIDQAIQPYGLRVYKRWIDRDDDFVRETHMRVGGTELPIGEPFVFIDGDSGQAPGLCGTAQNNVNCRCVLEFSIH